MSPEHMVPQAPSPLARDLDDDAGAFWQISALSLVGCSLGTQYV